MRIGLVTSEIFPFSKTGGLGDVSGALAKYLPAVNGEVRVVTPMYSQINLDQNDFYAVDFLQGMTVDFDGWQIGFSVYTAKIPGTQTDVYFINCPQLYHRWGIYTDDGDEYLRFALLNRAALEIYQRMAWAPDILHCSDWQSALIPLYLKSLYAWDSLFARTKTVLTIHNIGYQGVFGMDVAYRLGFGAFTHLLDDLDTRAGRFNFLKCGIIHADKITTVSETYAREIQTPEYGAGLEAMLAYRSANLVGIMNGIDYDEWDPATDRYIAQNYSIKTLADKFINKKALCSELELVCQTDRPLIGMVSRLVYQKGIDLIEAVMDKALLERKFCLVVLGSGFPRFEAYFAGLQRRHPERVSFTPGYNNALAHKIEAAADIFLMPSKYEPCGLNQLYSLKYGTVPIVRKTGGLADSVELYDWENLRGDGFVFEDYTPPGLAWALNYALDTYQHTDSWQQIMRNGMQKDFSWQKQIGHYVRLYEELKLQD